VTRVALPARTADDWRSLLAEPTVRATFARTPALANVATLVVVPEHIATLPGADSPTNVFVLARAADGLAVIALERPGAERFGPTVGAWRADTPDGGGAQLAAVLGALGLDAAPDGIRYELLRHTAAALAAADAFAARHAVVLVHTVDRTDFEDYAALVTLFGAEARAGELSSVARGAGRMLHLGWAEGAPAPRGRAAASSPDDQLRDQLSAILGGPVDLETSALFAYGDPVEVLVRADPHAVHVEVPVVEWRGHTAVLTGERRASFPREGVTRLGGDAPFIEAVYTARAERVARFRTCAECGERKPPESMRGATLCAACAERDRRGAY